MCFSARPAWKLESGWVSTSRGNTNYLPRAQKDKAGMRTDGVLRKKGRTKG